MQRLLLIVGGIVIVAVSFFGTLYFLNSMDFRSLDTVRTEDAKSLKAALEQYRAARGKYPAPFPDNDVADLKPALVDGGFIAQLPVDPYWQKGKVNKYRYRSDGTSYGLLLYMELGPCLTGVGPAATGNWDGRKIISCAF